MIIIIIITIRRRRRIRGNGEEIGITCPSSVNSFSYNQCRTLYIRATNSMPNHCSKMKLSRQIAVL